ncbi:MAG: hypothetical protein OT477_02895 [Chloroflexi bacterium]|nr:hypothetical protein [Chloroflexota bacterium]
MALARATHPCTDKYVGGCREGVGRPKRISCVSQPYHVGRPTPTTLLPPHDWQK